MQKELSLIIKKIKPWIKDKAVLDVLIFGSSMRGKEKPSDIDLCIMIETTQEKFSLDLIDSLSKAINYLGFKFQINILTSKAFLEGNTLTKTLIEEGYSIRYEDNFSANFGFTPKSLFIYTLKHFSSSKRVRFHYLLNGRYGTKGILKEVDGDIIGGGIIEVPKNKEDLLKEIFDNWGIRYEIRSILSS